MQLWLNWLNRVIEIFVEFELLLVKIIFTKRLFSYFGFFLNIMSSSNWKVDSTQNPESWSISHYSELIKLTFVDDCLYDYISIIICLIKMLCQCSSKCVRDFMWVFVRQSVFFFLGILERHREKGNFFERVRRWWTYWRLVVSSWFFLIPIQWR